MEVRNNGFQSKQNYSSSNIDLGKSTNKEERNVTHNVGSEIIESKYYGEWHNEQFQNGTITFPGPLNNFKIKVKHCDKQTQSHNKYSVTIKFHGNQWFSGQMKTDRHGVIDSNSSLQGFLSGKESRPAYVKIKKIPFWTEQNEINMDTVDKTKHWQKWILFTNQLLGFMSKIERKDFYRSLEILVTEFKTGPENR